MIALLSVPLALGWVLSRYRLGYREWPALISSAVATAVVLTLVGTNFFYLRHPDLGAAVRTTLGIQAALLLLVYATRPTVEPVEPTPRWARWILGSLSMLVLLYSNAEQIAVPDDDFWIHTAQQGLMRHNNFPPVNPFFSDIVMNGHYGRNLAIIILSYLSGADVFQSQAVLTTGMQVMTLLLFYSAIRLGEQSHKSALLGTIFIFFGINAGGRGGVIDILQNNNPVVQMYLAFLFLLTLTIWTGRSKSATALGGIALGSYAIVYESHFGLVFLTILGATPILLFLKRVTQRQALSAFLMLALSLPLAFTQGGPLTEMLQRHNGSQSATGTELSKGMQNQAQVVEAGFPKRELFKIYLANGDYQRVSHVYHLASPLKLLVKPPTKTGYAYIWSWDVLQIHFLPLYLVPWSAFILFRRRSAAGLFLGAFGTISFLVPALINFGPIYEAEYYRWEVAASLGFAGALGMALATLLENLEPPSFLTEGSRVVVRPAGKRILLVAALSALNSVSSLHLVYSRFQESVSWNLKQSFVFPSTREWIVRHPLLLFSFLDYEAANWLNQQVKPGDRVLVDSPEENNFSILYDSTLTGITGARSVGHALPLEDEIAATTPYRRSPAARLFWQSKRPDALAQLSVDWLFVRGRTGEIPPHMPACELVKTFKMGDQERYVYLVDQSKLPGFEVRGLDNREPVRAVVKDLPEHMRGGRVYRFALEARVQPGQELDGVVHLSTRRRSDGLLSSPTEDLQLRVATRARDDGKVRIQLPFVAPYDEGNYELRVRFDVENAPPLESVGTFRSDFLEVLKGVELVDVTVPHQELDQLPSGSILVPQALLALPQELARPREVLACWSFYSEERNEFDQLPGTVLSKVNLSRDLEVPAVTPRRPGNYRMSLYLSGAQGKLVRVLGPAVTIREEKE